MIKVLSVFFILIAGAMAVAGCSPTTVKDGDIITVDYTLTLDDGTVYFTTGDRGPVQYTMGKDVMLQGFREGIIGMKVGEIRTVVVPPEKAYGERRNELIVPVDKERFSPNIELEVGKRLQTTLADGTPTIVVITEIGEKTVTVDANHPLAGENLTFKIDLISIDQIASADITAQSTLIWILAAALILLTAIFILYYAKTQRILRNVSISDEDDGQDSSQGRGRST